MAAAPQAVDSSDQSAADVLPTLGGTPAYLLFKRILDAVAAGIGLTLLCPLFVLIAIAIKLDSPGPALFKQRRAGARLRRSSGQREWIVTEFEMYKFRSMSDGSSDDAHRAYIESFAQGSLEGREKSFKLDNDSRITRTGHWLRRTSLDELPQLINVLLGDMSLVGPRPHAVSHNEEFAKIVDGYLARHRVKPGITGWAQVNGLRGETATTDLMRRRVQYDLDYIENWSLLFDLKIILLTFFTGFVHENAY
jgi:putative colanic acid biosynthesis UDP-glucose lipid carrier transferase